jgi:hypothetical protein
MSEDGETDRQIDKHIYMKTDIQGNGWTDRWIDRQTNGQANYKIGAKIDKQIRLIIRQMDR